MRASDVISLNGHRLESIIKHFGFEADSQNHCWRKNERLYDYNEVEKYIKAVAVTFSQNGDHSNVLLTHQTREVMAALDSAKNALGEIDTAHSEAISKLSEYRQKLISTQKQLIEANQQLLERAVSDERFQKGGTD